MSFKQKADSLLHAHRCPGLVTEGNTIDEVLANIPDAAKATLELYAERNLSPPDEIFVHASGEPVTVKPQRRFRCDLQRISEEIGVVRMPAKVPGEGVEDHIGSGSMRPRRHHDRTGLGTARLKIGDH